MSQRFHQLLVLGTAGLLVVACALTRSLDEYEAGGDPGSSGAGAGGVGQGGAGGTVGGGGAAGGGGTAASGGSGTGGSGGSGGTVSGGGSSGDGGAVSGGGSGGVASPCEEPCTAPTPYCHPTLDQCTECIESNHCPDEPVCSSLGKCVAGSGGTGGGGTGGSGGCNPPCEGLTPVCHGTSCVQCTLDAECAVFALPRCRNNVCVECLTTTAGDCNQNERCHPELLECLPKCQTQNDCQLSTATPYCETTLDMCVECLNTTQCSLSDVCVDNECV